jgi:amidohydrolase family protein
VLAGFWNSHVHFTEAAWRGAESRPAVELARAMQEMLTRWGVVHAVDLGSNPADTFALRRRIDSDEIPGPSIVSAGGGFAPVGGSPFYILPLRLPELASEAGAATMVERFLGAVHADVVKLFTGSWATPESIVVMPVDVVRAAVTVAHQHGKLVFAHPSSSAGARAAIEGGVDVLAHTFPSELDRKPWDRTLPGMMRARQMALVPTLKLVPNELRKRALPASVVERVVGNAQAQLRAFAELGGQILFGTDVGYMTDHDPTDEYVMMQQAGLSYPAILTALTTAPADRLGAGARSGKLAIGMNADVVVVDGEPERDIRGLARVRLTVRAGRTIYERR